MAERHNWTIEENVKVMECFYMSNPTKRGYRKRMHELWNSVFPEFVVSEQRLLDQKTAIVNGQFLSTMELEHIQSRVCGTPIADENNVEGAPVVSMATTAVVQRPPESL